MIGVAPEAQLVVMQVFQRGGGASWATILAALEDCVRLEVDACNLSLGSAAGFVDPEDNMLETLNLFLDTDIQVLIAAGNDTHNAYMNRWGLDMSLIENPDIGLVGTPASYSAALAVASMDNNGYEMMSFVVGGRELGFQDTAVSSYTSFIQNFRNEELEYVVVPGFGTADDYEGIDVTGKIALVSRGTTSFPEKQAVAQEKGAIGIIVYNNVLGFFGMQINDGEGNIPAVSIAKAAGEKLVAKYPGLTICGAADGYFKDEKAVIEQVNAAKPDVLFVCLGAPKQEKFIKTHFEELDVTLMLGLGGSLDGYAGVAQRAPKWMIDLSLEWLYRLLKEPKRLGRMMRLPKFVLACGGEKLRRKRNG